MKINFILKKQEIKMSFVLAMLTILSSPVCGPSENIVTENFNFEKPATPEKKEKVVYKKIPTKWVKITKKSN